MEAVGGVGAMGAAAMGMADVVGVTGMAEEVGVMKMGVGAAGTDGSARAMVAPGGVGGIAALLSC